MRPTIYPPPPTQKSVYTAEVGLLFLSTFLFFASFNMLIPELPNYLRSLGGEAYIGLIIALFTATAAISRPFSGKLADTIGRIPVMMFGVAVCFMAGLLYPVLNFVLGFLVLRLVHGFSTGFTPTGNSAYLADIVPFEKRGEAMGILGLANSIGMAMGPAIGSMIVRFFSIEILFFTSSALALLAGLVLLRMRETVAQKQPFRWALLRIRREEIWEPRVTRPSVVMLLSAMPFGAVLTVLPDFSEHLGADKGLFFMSFTLASLVVRVVAGKVSDRIGRVIVVRVANLGMAAAFVFLSFVDTTMGLVMAAVFFGFFSGMNSPTLFAWTIDLGHPNYRGRAMGTIFIALELGIGLGALGSAWVYGSQVANFPLTFHCCAGATTLALLYTCLPKKKTIGSSRTHLDL